MCASSPWKVPKDSMDSTLLPTAERLRHRRQEDVTGSFSSHSAIMLCTQVQARRREAPPQGLPAGPPSRRPPLPPALPPAGPPSRHAHFKFLVKQNAMPPSQGKEPVCGGQEGLHVCMCVAPGRVSGASLWKSGDARH